MKNASVGLINRLDMSEIRTTGLDYTSTESQKTEKRIKTEKKEEQKRISKDCGKIIKVLHLHNGKLQEKKKNRAIFEGIMRENFPKLMPDTKPQIQHSEKTEYNKCQNSYI